ncbi:glutamate-5-semialdehyde dehydrogenase [Priestia endophytica]|uniref:glutamate-5-semialdehyde dehydrogenase n=1 Tax=Priestia endophytica TaxID=135735 RepID=UPI00227F7E79|nr:glutamate-5-semialdehyde dehydrogenase [Priestia endophytica]MCY8234689.1 glutamate-5-semialdehyde dehydrogenase [Priestia endophytica]
MSEVIEKGQRAKEAASVLVHKTTDEKNSALTSIAAQLLAQSSYILEENSKDIEENRAKGVEDSLLDRLLLTTERLEGMAHGIEQLVKLEDPTGKVLQTIERNDGLKITEMRVPLGVVGMIYEARPNVTVDASTLCLKTGNAVILRGSSSAHYSNKAIVNVIHNGLKKAGFPKEAVQLIEDTSRQTAKELFTLNEYLDVLIPRGGKNLIQTVVREASVPVLETGAGNCHIFIDESADVKMAFEIVINAKTQRPSVCNAIETVLVHDAWLALHGKDLLSLLMDHGVEVHGDEAVCQLHSRVQRATEDDWEQEYLNKTVAMKRVLSVGEAVSHINKYGTKHSEAIITNDESHVKEFFTSVDAAALYHNASTRFTDGFEFGFGSEIGISTQKLHARGPMGLKALTSTKFVIRGNGQIKK